MPGGGLLVEAGPQKDLDLSKPGVAFFLAGTFFPVATFLVVESALLLLFHQRPEEDGLSPFLQGTKVGAPNT